MDNLALEYTPELSKSYLMGELNDINEGGRMDEGRAVAESNDRGMSGQAMMGSMIGAARSNTANRRSRAIGDFNMNVAGLNREERLYNTRTKDTRDYESSEAQKNRDFQEHLASMGYEFSRGERNSQNRADEIAGQKGAVIGAMSNSLSMGQGAALASFMSDRRLKKNIIAIGIDGPLTVYEFNYRGDTGFSLPAGRQRGYMADDVEKYFPDAVCEYLGFKTVSSRFAPRSI